ncbi:MAG: hypothetical protein KME42_20285 [Tildeniella nuda ZEHNDER 1965/U140]|jgi:hypothetical protein|nr:hypothetical protein [Tildeniella nuda ZEHNDER 1965/U140]
MRSFIASSLLALTSLAGFVPQTQAQPRINFETQGCERTSEVNAMACDRPHHL